MRQQGPMCSRVSNTQEHYYQADISETVQCSVLISQHHKPRWGTFSGSFSINRDTLVGLLLPYILQGKGRWTELHRTWDIVAGFPSFITFSEIDIYASA